MAGSPARIEELAGEELGGVHFVCDYVEFYIGGPIIRSLACPILRESGREQPRFPAPGSRDALCALIGRRLVMVRADDEEGIVLRFDGGAEVLIQPEDGSVEIAHFVPGPNRPISVW